MNEFSEEKIIYLGMVQNTIDRMSANSTILKGFAATVVTGISAISFTDISKWVLLISIVPVFSFLTLDLYYLVLERKFRYIYKQICQGNKSVDFSMETDIPKNDLCKANSRLRDCLRSPSIWLFYIPVILVVIVITLLKFLCII